MAIIGPLPYNIVNGTLEDASQVMANFLWILNQVNTNAGSAGSTGVPNYQTFTASQGQTVFTLTSPYTVGNNTLNLFMAGARLEVGTDYVESTVNSFTLNVGANLNDRLIAITLGAGPAGPAGSPGAQGPAGTITAVVPAGVWAGGTTYAINQFVTFNPGVGTAPNTYVSLQNGNLGNTPPTPPTNSTAWWNLVGPGGTNGAGSGTVTHTVGALASGYVVIGNSGADEQTSNYQLPPNASGVLGYLGVPQNSQSSAYGLALSDQGGSIYHPSSDATARTWTIPANSSVAFPVGTAITLDNESGAGVITIAITTDTLTWLPSGGTGSRTLTGPGQATIYKATSTSWHITGVGLT